MIDFNKIAQKAFINELYKLANIEVDGEGKVIYHSNDKDNPKKKMDDARLGYESYTEDTAAGSAVLRTEPSPN